MRNQRVVVTGGAGFLGSFVVEKLQACGAAVFVPRIENYDLVDLSAIRRLLAEPGRTLSCTLQRGWAGSHSTALRGGYALGANRAHPAEFFYDNLMTPAPTAGAVWACR